MVVSNLDRTIEALKKKMMHHLNKMEEWQATVDDYEQRAMITVHATAEPKRSDGSEQDPEYRAKKLLADVYGYGAACGKRSGYQKAVDTYALVVIALGTKR